MARVAESQGHSDAEWAQREAILQRETDELWTELERSVLESQEPHDCTMKSGMPRFRAFDIMQKKENVQERKAAWQRIAERSRLMHGTLLPGDLQGKAPL